MWRSACVNNSRSRMVCLELIVGTNLDRLTGAAHRESMAAQTLRWRADHQHRSCARWVRRAHTIHLPATPLVFCPTSRGQLCEVRHDAIWLALQVCDLRAGVDILPGRVVHRVDGGPQARSACALACRGASGVAHFCMCWSVGLGTLKLPSSFPSGECIAQFERRWGSDLGVTKVCPVLHHGPSFFQRVPAPVGCFHLVLKRMG